MWVAGLVPGEPVVWECVDGPGEWVGTTITFDIYPGPRGGGGGREVHPRELA